VSLLDSGKPNKAILEEVNTDGIVGEDRHVEPHVELEAVDKQWGMDVLRQQHLLVEWNLQGNTSRQRGKRDNTSCVSRESGVQQNQLGIDFAQDITGGTW